MNRYKKRKDNVKKFNLNVENHLKIKAKYNKNPPQKKPHMTKKNIIKKIPIKQHLRL